MKLSRLSQAGIFMYKITTNYTIRAACLHAVYCGNETWN
jgi:hypothetical protein